MKHYTLLEIQYLQSIYLEQFDMYEEWNESYSNEYIINHLCTSNFIVWLQQMEEQNKTKLLINNYKSKF